MRSIRLRGGSQSGTHLSRLSRDYFENTEHTTELSVSQAQLSWDLYGPGGDNQSYEKRENIVCGRVNKPGQTFFTLPGSWLGERGQNTISFLYTVNRLKGGPEEASLEKCFPRDAFQQGELSKNKNQGNRKQPREPSSKRISPRQTASLAGDILIQDHGTTRKRGKTGSGLLVKDKGGEMTFKQHFLAHRGPVE